MHLVRVRFIFEHIFNIVVEAQDTLGKELIKKENKDQVVNVVLHTLKEHKQVLVFNNSKNSSEATAERIALALNVVEHKKELKEISDKILSSLSTPTKQCRRLARCVEKGIAFHHSGLVGKQRTLIEKGFKDKIIKVISSTPTLAAGLNLPAYKVVIKDYKRYSPRGFNDIPILEYHQMAGRAGRPGVETTGRAVVLVKDEAELQRVVSKYIHGKPEEIISKLAVESTLKMYILSLVSIDVINTKKEIKEFFANTLYGHQYQDLEALHYNIFRILDVLKNYGFIVQEDNYYMATSLGRKVSELYLNPDTAHKFLTNFDVIVKRFVQNYVSKSDIFALLQFISSAQEMKPLFRVAKKEEETYMAKMEEVADDLIEEYDPFEVDYLSFAQTLKTTDILLDWILEAPEDYITEKYSITPGELNYKNDVVDWLLYCLEEFSTLQKQFYLKNFFNKLRIRFKHGIRNELLPLITLKGVGRVRARKLYDNGLKSISDLKVADFKTLSRVVGDSLAIKIKEQVLGEFTITRGLDQKPKEITQREVSDDEVDVLIDHTSRFEKEKEEVERQHKLTDFF